MDDGQSDFWKLSAAGFAATAITYGPARMGFGLFLPEFRSAFSLSTQTAGFISGLGFAGFFLGLLLAQILTARNGPRRPVLLGLISAAAGMCIVAVAPNAIMLAIGVFLAMSSAGFSWSPFNNAVHRRVPGRWRASALSAISTGTALGVAGAGLAALAMHLSGLSWRLFWGAFASVAALAILLDRSAMIGVARHPGPGRSWQWRALLRSYAMPLFAIGLSFGLTSAVYISFAADRIERAGGVPGVDPATAPALVFVFYGIFGLCGIWTGRLRDKLGLTWLLRFLFIASTLSHALVALVPGSWGGLIASAGLQGVMVMMTSAALSFWSEQLFPRVPAQGFTAALLALALGSVLGPIVAGSVASAAGSGPMFWGVAAISAGTAVALLRFRLSDAEPAPH